MSMKLIAREEERKKRARRVMLVQNTHTDTRTDGHTSAHHAVARLVEQAEELLRQHTEALLACGAPPHTDVASV